MLGHGEKKTIVEDRKEERSEVATTVGNEKKDEWLLMRSLKRKQQLFGMNKGKNNCCWGSIRLLRHIL
jgi:hypothetical protein